VDEAGGCGNLWTTKQPECAQSTVNMLNAWEASQRPVLGILSVSDNDPTHTPCSLRERRPETPGPRDLSDWGVCLELAPQLVGEAESYWTTTMRAIADWREARGKTGTRPGGAPGPGPTPDPPDTLAHLERILEHCQQNVDGYETIDRKGGWRTMFRWTFSGNKERKLREGKRQIRVSGPRCVDLAEEAIGELER
ncbi:MAG: hypothetical protein KJN97_06190, partial [Deltaproteobacteria bacterium]|nr:hypothetical protein [Deltaproteobacteria bacterium]